MLSDAFVFPVPEPTYTASDMAGYLCWIPWDNTTKGQEDKAKSTASGDNSHLLPCIWLPASASSSVVVFLHANAEDLGMMYTAMHLMQQELQVSVLAVEYPGYGLLKGQPPSEEGCYKAAEASVQYLVREMGVDYSNITVVGRSMGSAPACRVASRYPIGGLILVNAFVSVRAVAQEYVGAALSRLLCPDVFNNESMLPTVRCPVLLIHGTNDRVISPEHSMRLFGRCRGKKHLVHPEDMGHNTCIFDSPAFFSLHAVRFFDIPKKGTPPVMPMATFVPPVSPTVCCSAVVAQGQACGKMCGTTQCPIFIEETALEVALPPEAVPALGSVLVEDSKVYQAHMLERVTSSSSESTRSRISGHSRVPSIDSNSSSLSGSLWSGAAAPRVGGPSSQGRVRLNDVDLLNPSPPVGRVRKEPC